MRPESAADCGVRFIGRREITTITLPPRLFPLLRSAFVAGVAALGKEPMVLPDAYHACTRAFAAAAAAATPGSPLVLILPDDAAEALVRGCWEIHGGDTSASDDEWGQICDALGID
jgi:hypothetical protein